MGWFTLVYTIGGVLLMPKTTQYTYNTLRKVSQKYIGLQTYLLKLAGVLHNLTKTYKENKPCLGYSVNTMG